jgi:hypothetical protein
LGRANIKKKRTKKAEIYSFMSLISLLYDGVSATGVIQRRMRYGKTVENVKLGGAREKAVVAYF